MQHYSRRVVGTNFDGRLYPVPERHDKVVIVLGGSEGGLYLAKKQARWLQQQGMPALAVGYFRTAHTDRTLSLVPLEGVEEAIMFLQAQGYVHIGILGISKGAELALVAASQLPVLSCVVVKTPSWYVGEGLAKKAPSGTSSWVYHGIPLPYTPYRLRMFHAVRLVLQAGEYNLLSLNVGKRIVPDSIIPVERIAGPILVLSTRADTIWPSEASGNQLTLRLAQSHYAYSFQHNCYLHMGHFMLERTGLIMRLLFRSERRWPKACASERQQMAATVMDWLEYVW